MEKRIQCRKMAHEKKKLLKQVDYMLSTFDNALAAIRQERFQLQADLKSADMKRLILYKELVLLKEFEKRDTELKRKMDNKLKEQSEVEGKISECLEKLQERKEEIERVIAKKEAVVKEFDGLVEESNSFREPLLKIFLRKIKRIKRKRRKMTTTNSRTTSSTTTTTSRKSVPRGATRRSMRRSVTCARRDSTRKMPRQTFKNRPRPCGRNARPSTRSRSSWSSP